MAKSRFLVLSLVLALLGCGGKTDPPSQPQADTSPTAKDNPTPPADPVPTAEEQTAPKEAVPTAAPAAPAWTQDVPAMRFPATPAAGKLRGQAFAPQTAELSRVRGRFLSLRQGEEFNPDLEVKILLSGAKDESFAGKTFEIAADASPGPVPGVSVLWKAQERQPSESLTFNGKYALRLEFGPESDGKLPGKIYLCLPDEAKSYVAGTFTAAVEPDYSRPPRPDEAPCVVGRIALKARDEINVVTGIIGLSAEGAPVANLTGTVIVPGAETSVSLVGVPPQRSSLVNDAEAGCQCRHARLAPGRYLVFVGTGDRYIDWRWVEVKDKAPPALDFTLDPQEAGVLEVVLPKEAKDGLRLIPLDDAGKVPDVKDALNALSLAMKTDVPVKDGKMVLDGLRPGRYRAGAGEVEKDVTVKAKEAVKVDLTAP